MGEAGQASARDREAMTLRTMTLTRAAIALAAISLASACSTGGPDSTEATSDASASADAGAAMRAVAACLRSNGYPNAPDPVQDDEGRWGFPDAPAGSMPNRTTKTPCDDLGRRAKSLDRGRDPEQVSAADLVKLRAYAVCVRRNGIADWPDPSARDDGTSMHPGGCVVIRVLIVDDHEVVRQGLRFVLEQEPGIEVAGECADGSAAMAAIEELTPDVVLLDLVMPVLDGLGVLQGRPQRPAVIVLTTFLAEVRTLDAVRAGALSYLPKTTTVERVVEAVRAAAEGGSVLDPSVAAVLAQRVRDGADTGPLAALSRREREVLAALSQGRSNREIARQLSLSEETVKTYVSSILAKLHLQDRTQAAIFGLQQGLVPLDSALREEGNGRELR